jgi:dephospho-CoA kinase
MRFVGLTGGIGSGKSTVGASLRRLGAVIIDVDSLSRDLQEPGQPLFEEIVARWGDPVVDAEGRLDRRALASIVFSDRDQLAELTSMAAPFTEQEIVRQASSYLGTDRCVIVEAAMYARPMYGMSGLIVVDVPSEVAVARLVGLRLLDEADARARIASQLPRASRLRDAGFVIDNAGTVIELEERIREAWAWIADLPPSVPTLDRT